MVRRPPRRGVWYTLAVGFNRIVPAAWCRVVFVRVIELKSAVTSPDAGTTLEPVEAISDDQRRVLSDVTLQPTPPDRPARGWMILGPDGQTIGGCWATTQAFIDTSIPLRWRLNDADVWLHAARLLPEHRGAGRYGKFIDAVLRQHSAVNVFAAINPVNHRSIAAHASRAHRTLGHVIAVRIGTWRWAICTGSLRPSRTTTADSTGIIEIECRMADTTTDQ